MHIRIMQAFLMIKKTLTVEEMNEIFDMMDDEKRYLMIKGISKIYI